jgi:hypothetical protein
MSGVGFCWYCQEMTLWTWDAHKDKWMCEVCKSWTKSTDLDTTLE